LPELDHCDLEIDHCLIEMGCGRYEMSKQPIDFQYVMWLKTFWKLENVKIFEVK
jgi:hypothetical protein